MFHAIKKSLSITLFVVLFVFVGMPEINFNIEVPGLLLAQLSSLPEKEKKTTNVKKKKKNRKLAKKNKRSK